MKDEDTITNSTSMEEILKIAIRRADHAYTFDKAAAERAQMRTTKEMFMRMAEEEIEHRDKLKKELEELIDQTKIDEALSGEAY